MGIFGKLTKIVKILIIINVSLFIVDTLLDGRLQDLLGLSPEKAIYGLQIWQIVTYMFVHANVFHLLFNMLALWMFGGPVEEAMGSKKFLRYYFLCGLGAALCVCIFSWHSLSIGASGAIFGILVAFGMLFPEAPVLVFFIFPMRAKYFVLLFAAIELFVTLSYTRDSIAHFAHLGGMLTGYLYLKYHYKLEEMYSVARNYKRVKMHQKESRVKIQQEIHDKNLQERVDRILDKIRESGLESLSREEHETLDAASERLREKEEKVIDINEYRDRYR
jgi:membrane associated rhomboid family serine protease